MRVVSYSRKSQESEEGIARQKTLAREFAGSKGWVISAEYEDDGVSGAEFHARPGFSRLMADAKAKCFDAIVTMSTDRIGREAFRTNMALLELAEAGVRVFTYQDRQEVRLSSPIEKQMVSMRNYAAEDFRAQIADKTKAAMLVKARAGRVIGKLPYGYDLKRVGEGKGSHAEYVVNETERAVVERVFTLAAGGTGNRRIVNLLADEKVPAPGRAGWSKQIIARMLSNRLYIGEVVYGRTCADALGGHSKKRARVTDESRWTTVQVPALRIISEPLWKQVQKRRAATLEHFGSHRGADGRLNGKPEAGLIAAHLLNGFTVYSAYEPLPSPTRFKSYPYGSLPVTRPARAFTSIAARVLSAICARKSSAA